MKKQNVSSENLKEKVLVDTEGLKELLCCGRHSAVKIGEQAHAKVKIGKRVLWSTKAVLDFVETARL